jgi:penicillin-insensitive murein endopeptidase
MAILVLGAPVGAQLAPATGASEARAGGVTPPAPAPAAVEVAPPPADSAAAGPVAASPSQPSAKALFGAMKSPAQLEARALGSYAKGCLAGARALPIDGPAWQAMRLSRNRNWGHPDLIQMVERLATEARAFDGWNGLLVGDISQPRGGPMLTGHNSHQIGLDADIWFTPMPDRRLTAREREELSATSMLAPDRLSVDPKVWSPAHVQIVKRAAGYRDVERVLVHPAIKKALCESATGDRAWLGKVRPIWGHYYHFHVRMGCPAGSTGCVPQTPPPGDDGCGKELADWYVLLTKPPEPPSGKPPPPPKPELTLDQLPAECRVVLEVGIARPAPTEARGALAPTSASTKAATSKAAATKSAGAAAVGKSDRP